MREGKNPDALKVVVVVAALMVLALVFTLVS